MERVAKILDGRVVADHVLQSVKAEVDALSGRKPCLAVLRVGDDAASVSYVRQKTQKAALVGIKSIVRVLNEATTTEDQLLMEISALNQDSTVDGILVQAPLPSSMDFTGIVSRIVPEKDVDGFGAYNCGRLLQDQPRFVPCTPAGIIELLKFYQISPAGKHVVIVNRSLIVGKPLGALLLSHSDFGNATVTICHSQSQHLAQITQQADVLVLACGRPSYFTAEFIKPGAVVIDVGITRISAQNGKGFKLHGDADFEHLQHHVYGITPVPGGVGPLTVAMLMKNTLKAYHYVNLYRSATRSSSGSHGAAHPGHLL